MEELRTIIGENLANLRKEKGLTQLELADYFNYSDKAISKWEKGDTLPDVETLYKLCDFYGVTLDYLTHEGNRKDKSQYLKQDEKRNFRNDVISTAMILTMLWMILTIVYVYVYLKNDISLWIVFIWGIPGSALILAVTNKKYFKSRLNAYLSNSLFNWSLITAVYLQVLYINAWPLFLVGIPAQIFLLLWANFIPTKGGK